MCISLHAPSKKLQIAMRFTGYFRIVDPWNGTCFMLSFWHVELLEHFWLPGTDCVFLDVQSVLFTVTAVRTSNVTCSFVLLFCCLFSLE